MTLLTRDELFEHYQKNKGIIQNRLKEFSEIKGDKESIFYELCFCLLTPGSNGKRCAKAVDELRKIRFHEAGKRDVSEILRKHTRFYKHKHDYLQNMIKSFPLIWEQLQSIKNSGALREWLVKEVKGLGYKEASHFLRNIGFRGLTILDRHVLKNLASLDVIEEIPKTLTRKKYLEIEEKLKQFSNSVKIDVDYLDLLFWSAETGEVFK